MEKGQLVRSDASFDPLPEERKLKWDFSCCHADVVVRKLQAEIDVFKTWKRVKSNRKSLDRREVA